MVCKCQEQPGCSPFLASEQFLEQFPKLLFPLLTLTWTSEIHRQIVCDWSVSHLSASSNSSISYVTKSLCETLVMLTESLSASRGNEQWKLYKRKLLPLTGS